MTDVKIALHPEYGLNATIPQCFWCKKLKGGITPLGSTIEGKAEPVSVLNYEPCEECKASMSAGISIIEVDLAEKLMRPPIIVIAAPTGRWFTLPEQHFREVAALLKLTDSHVIPVLSNRRMFTEADIYNRILPAASVPPPIKSKNIRGPTKRKAPPR